MSRFLPPSKVLQDVVVRNAIIGDGSNIKARSRVSNSIIGLRSLIGEDVVMEDTLMLGSDYYETVEECAWVPGEVARLGRGVDLVWSGGKKGMSRLQVCSVYAVAHVAGRGGVCLSGG